MAMCEQHTLPLPGVDGHKHTIHPEPVGHFAVDHGEMVGGFKLLVEDDSD